MGKCVDRARFYRGDLLPAFWIDPSSFGDVSCRLLSFLMSPTIVGSGQFKSGLVQDISAEI